MQTIYQPLDQRRSQIRLIEIISIGGSEKVKCKLSVSSLEDNVEFAALSYVWGDPKVTKDIILNNEIFPVTTNLAAALKHVKAHWCNAFPDRNPGLFRIWADAICINQKDPEERSSQVNLMRDIYAKAELVLSWLGHRIDEIDVALKALKTIAKETRELSSPEARPWKATRNFFGLPYWQRVWIFQELVLGKRILL
ncbi:HET-domain-containing protein, partial [Hyaloscypha bicolor E]